MKKYIFSSLIFIFIAALIIAGIWLVVKPDQLSPEELAFLKQEGFLDEEGNPFRSPGLFQQDINVPDESFQVLATKLNKNTGSYQLAFKLENKSNENKEFFLIPVSERDQLEFKEIKGVINNKNILSINKDDVKKDPLESLYDIKQHKKELNPELAKAYDDMEGNNYQGDPIKIILAPNSNLVAKSQWEIKQDKKSEDLKPVYFLVYGSAGGAKEELTILTVHSHPAQGDDWPVEFTTVGMADLKIIPDDQDTIDDDEFTGLFCNGEERFPEILEGDVIYYPDWECLPRQSGAEAGDGIGKVVHYTLKAGNHKLRFEFADQISYAYNNPGLTFHSGFETGTNNFDEWSTTTGSPTVQSTIKKTGTYAMRANASGSATYISGHGANKLSFYMYIASAPNFETIILRSTDPPMYGYLSLTTDRYLKIYDGSDVLQGTGTTQLNTATWYRIGFTVGSSKTIFINGNSEMSGSINWAAGSINIGVLSAVTADIYFDDVATDGIAGDTDIGDIRVLASLPNADGTNTDFVNDETGTTRPFYDSTDELPGDAGVDNTYVWYDDSVDALDSEETVGLQNSSTIGLGASDTINAVNIVVRMKRGNGASSTHQIVEYDTANTETTQALTTAFTTYTKYRVSPPTSASWTQSVFDAYEIGTGNPNDGGRDTYISSAIAMVAYTPDAGSASTISEVTDGPDAIEVGQTITFNVTWTDADAPDGQHMYICKDDDGTSVGCGGGGTWCEDSDTYDTTSPLSCTYVIASGDVGVQNYYAFTCDVATNCSTTGAATQGTFTAKVDGSPAMKFDGGITFRGGIKISERLSWNYCGDPLIFTYRGSLVTYGTVLSQGECWLNRNLGASQVATAFDDSSAYGDLFQWGRLDDNHQDRASGTTTSLSASDDPGHSNFIYQMDSPYDWRDGQNNNLWQGVSGINNPCPSGWRLPTQTEWDTERQSWSSNNYNGAYASPLKLTAGGARYHTDAIIQYDGSIGYYWAYPISGTNSMRIYFTDSDAVVNAANRAYGFSVRCIKD